MSDTSQFSVSTSQFMSVSSFTLSFGLADDPRLDLLAAAFVTQWPQMTNKMTPMTQMTNKMTQHDWKFQPVGSQFMSASSFTLIFGVFAGDASTNARLASNFKDIPNFASDIGVRTI